MFVQADDPKRLDAVGEDGHGAAGSHGQLEIEGKIIELHTDRKLRSRLNRRNVVLRALPEEENRAKEILARHTDKDWSLCDAISFAVMESRGVQRALAFDRHFHLYGRFKIIGLHL